MRIRILGYLVLASLAFTALAAVIVLIFGQFDDTASRILGTSASVAGYSLLLMAGVVAFAKEAGPGLRVAGGLGVAGSLIGLATMMLLIWAELHTEKAVVKTCGVASVAAGSMALVVQMARIRLPGPREWMRAATVALVLLLAGLLAVPVILLEIDSESLGRTIGVVSVLTVLGLLSTPIVAWQAVRERRPPALRPDPAGGMRMICPGCGRELAVAPGRSRCAGCGQGIEISLFRD